MNFLTGVFAQAQGCATLGARSEHIDVVPAGQGPWTGKVLHTEDLGSDNYIFVDIGSDEPVIVRQGGKSSITLDSTVSLRPQEGRLYKFDGSGRPMA